MYWVGIFSILSVSYCLSEYVWCIEYGYFLYYLSPIVYQNSFDVLSRDISYIICLLLFIRIRLMYWVGIFPILSVSYCLSEFVWCIEYGYFLYYLSPIFYQNSFDVLSMDIFYIICLLLIIRIRLMYWVGIFSILSASYCLSEFVWCIEYGYFLYYLSPIFYQNSFDVLSMDIFYIICLLLIIRIRLMYWVGIFSILSASYCLSEFVWCIEYGYFLYYLSPIFYQNSFDVLSMDIFYIICLLLFIRIRLMYWVWIFSILSVSYCLSVFVWCIEHGPFYIISLPFLLSWLTNGSQISLQYS